MKLQMPSCWRRCRNDASTMEVLHRVVVFLTVIYFAHEFYYSVKRLYINPWNARKSQVTFQALVDSMNLTKNRTLTDGVTAVTAFFEIGNLDKSASLFSSRDLKTYEQWMAPFQYFDNPVIFFTDSDTFAEKLQKMRIGMAETNIIRINRNTLYSFQLSERIKTVFSQPGYPDHSPNTVNENYSCIMHSKFELITKVIKEEMYSTKYLAWLDLGYFRHVDSTIFNFHKVPVNFDDNKISFTELYSREKNASPESIIRGNNVWVAGGLFIARPEVMLVFAEDYMKSVEALLDMKWMSTDQQVIYSMYTPNFPVKPRIEIQAHTVSDRNWFHLGDIIRENVLINLRRNVSVINYFLQLL